MSAAKGLQYYAAEAAHEAHTSSSTDTVHNSTPLHVPQIAPPSLFDPIPVYPPPLTIMESLTQATKAPTLAETGDVGPWMTAFESMLKMVQERDQKRDEMHERTLLSLADKNRELMVALFPPSRVADQPVASPVAQPVAESTKEEKKAAKAAKAAKKAAKKERTPVDVVVKEDEVPAAATKHKVLSKGEEAVYEEMQKDESISHNFAGRPSSSLTQDELKTLAGYRKKRRADAKALIDHGSDILGDEFVGKTWDTVDQDASAVAWCKIRGKHTLLLKAAKEANAHKKAGDAPPAKKKTKAETLAEESDVGMVPADPKPPSKHKLIAAAVAAPAAIKVKPQPLSVDAAREESEAEEEEEEEDEEEEREKLRAKKLKAKAKATTNKNALADKAPNDSDSDASSSVSSMEE